MTKKRDVDVASKLPSNLDAENAVISALLFQHCDSPNAIELLSAEDFSDRANGIVFAAVKNQYEKGKSTDPLAVSDSMDAKDLELVGGLQRLASLSGDMYARFNLENSCKLIIEKRRQRQLLFLLHKFQDDVEEETVESVDAILDSLLLDLTAISSQAPSDDLTDYQAGVQMLVGLDDPAKGRIFCGVRGLDEITGGFRAGELIILTAETGTGKTLLASQIKRLACANGNHSLFCNGEMLAAHLRARDVAVRARVPYAKFRRPEQLTKEEHSIIMRVVGEGCTKCRIMDGELGISRIRSRIRKYATQEIAFLIVDYDELVDAPGKDEFAMQRAVTRGLKSLALELKIPVLLISQLRKTVEKEDRSKPTLSRLYGSGSKVKTASVVMYVDRPFVRELKGDETEARIVVVKNRDGKVGSIECKFNIHTLEFEDIDGAPKGRSLYE